MYFLEIPYLGWKIRENRLVIRESMRQASNACDSECMCAGRSAIDQLHRRIFNSHLFMAQNFHESCTSILQTPPLVIFLGERGGWWGICINFGLHSHLPIMSNTSPTKFGKFVFGGP